MNITLVGVGMGGRGTLTLEALEALRGAEVIVGARRLLAGIPDDIPARRIDEALPERIAEAVREHPEWRPVAVVLSGDVGFYSGAARILELLGDYEPRLLPGISTPQYFAARLRRPWQDFRLVSAHGVPCDVLAEALNHPAVFFLTGGRETPATIAAALREAGLGRAAMTVGENLGADDERIASGTADEVADMAFRPLSVALVENRETFSREARSGGIPDAEFVRGDSPMTKREVRAAALSFLAVKPRDILYDVGAGTGSVAVEMALTARRGRVFAIESNPAALALLQENRRKFGVYNLNAVSGTAPEAIRPLPPPDAVFVGGSKGRLDAIARAAFAKNPRARLVVSAVTIETLTAAVAALESLAHGDVAVTQIAAARTVRRGGYHMLEAQNPIFLVCGGCA